MQLDTEKQRQLLLEMLSVINVPGKSLDEVYALKQAIKSATIPEPAPHD
jgi:hypothetical protein